MPQETPQPLPVLDYGRRPRRRIPWRGIQACVAVVLGAFVMLLLQPRLLSFVLLGVFMAAGALKRLRREKYRIVAVLVVAASLFLPFDVALGRFHYGERHGTSPGGPHFVRFITGVRHSRRGTIDGEYIDGGHTFPDAIPPRWIWVWD